MFYYWEEVASRHFKIDRFREYFQREAINFGTLDMADQHRKNLRYWRAAAEEDYALRTNLFRKFEHADILQHDKHWLRSAVAFDQLLKRTKNGPAKYVFGYPIEKLEYALYDALRFNWRRVAEEKIPRLYVEFATVVGASLGKEAKHVRFDLNYADFVVHSHPILEMEKPANEPWLTDVDVTKSQYYEGIWDEPTIDEELDLSLYV